MYRKIGIGLVCSGLAVWGLGCAQQSAEAPRTPAQAEQGVASSEQPATAGQAAVSGMLEDEHGHQPGAHGGIIVSLGRDSYHVEAIVTQQGELRLYLLGSDETRVHSTEEQELTAFVRGAEGSGDSVSMTVLPQPQPGDAAGDTSLFVGKLPESLVGQAVNVTIPNIVIGGERFRLGFTTLQESHAEAMPAKVADDAERELYLTPGGKYTEADIEANGRQTASQKFAGFKAAHDLSPQAGDKICPITLTKANPKCSWVIGGEVYEFCCPPCVDEFVRLAKTEPEKLKAPGEYVK